MRNGLRSSVILQYPWQPQSENLNSSDYYAMMQDPVKYSIYEKSLITFLDDNNTLRSSGVCICVVGAGFGGLVRSVLSALEYFDIGKKSHVILIEKNPVAITYLRNVIIGGWKTKGGYRRSRGNRATTTVNRNYYHSIELIDKDVRYLCQKDIPFTRNFAHIDAVVSELLGGFGDNELSPECLHPFEILCRRISTDARRQNTVFFPTKTSSFIAPAPVFTIQSILDCSNSLVENMKERLWVVAAARRPLCVDIPKLVYEFSHPCTDKMFTSYRENTLKFIIPRGIKCSGFFGYFCASMPIGSLPSYTSHPMLSNVNGQETSNLKEWNPVFFPTIKDFGSMDCDTTIDVIFRRCFDDKGVWYQWKVGGDWHNENGYVWKMLYCDGN